MNHVLQVHIVIDANNFAFFELGNTYLGLALYHLAHSKYYVSVHQFMSKKLEGAWCVTGGTKRVREFPGNFQIANDTDRSHALLSPLTS